MHETLKIFNLFLRDRGWRASQHNMKECKLCSNNDFYKHFSHSARTKVPEYAIVPGGRFWPPIAFEFGYAEPYEDLGDDVKLLLEGSGREISKAIIIKIEPLWEGETVSFLAIR